MLGRLIGLTLLAAGSLCACSDEGGEPPPAKSHPDEPTEPRLTNVRQLTFAGENAEAYWSWSGKQLIFQVRGRLDIKADQIFIMNPDGSGEHMVSLGTGKTACSYFLPGDEEIVYASTHHLGKEPPQPPEPTPGKYTWPLSHVRPQIVS